MTPTTVLFLFFIDLICVQTELFFVFVVSRPEHEGSVAIVGEYESCRSSGDAAFRCKLIDDCRGIWFYQNGTEMKSQAAKCPYSPSITNPAPGQARFLFLFGGVFGTCNSIFKFVLSLCMLFLSSSAMVNSLTCRP